MQREFTGRDLMKVMIAGFGVVVAVNLLMATLATRGFGGVIVENTYVASQNFNDWLAEAERGEALDWSAEVERDAQDDRLKVATHKVPAGARVVASLRRPLGPEQRQEVTFAPRGEGVYLAQAPVESGRWIVRLRISAGSQEWAQELLLQ